MWQTYVQRLPWLLENLAFPVATLQRDKAMQDDSHTPLVSVVIPTYNRARFIRDAISSALAQSYRNIEVIVVDDASTDETPSIIDEFGHSIRYIRQEKNSGVGAARNAGIRAARGTLVAFLDSDDRWHPQKIEKQVALWQADRSVGIVGGSCDYIDEQGNSVGAPNIAAPVVSYDMMCVSPRLPGLGSNILVRRDVLLEIGLFPEDMVRAEDYYLCLRIAERYPVRCIPDVTLHVRIHPEARPNVTLKKLIDSRFALARSITNKRLRRRHEGWMYFVLFRRGWQARRRLLALRFLLLAFVRWPRPLTPRHRRMKPAMRLILGITDEN